MSTPQEHPVLVIDAMNLYIRNFTANPSMSTQGYPAGGFVGFLTSLKLVCQKFSPSKVIIVWEGGGSSRRRAIYPDYKQRRRPQKLNRFYEDIPNTTDNYDKQILMLIETLKNVPVCQVYVDNCEADDVIGYISRYMFKDKNIIIMSSDKDLYQLVSQNISQWSPSKKLMITPDTVRELFNINYTNYCLTRCLVGDQSDCINGVPNVGFKTASRHFTILSEQSDLLVDDILTFAREKTKSSKLSIFKSVVDNEDIIRRNWKLMNLDTSNLSGSQIQKISSIITTYTPNKNKMSIMRLLVREGLQSFDVDSFFMSLKSIG